MKRSLSYLIPITNELRMEQLEKSIIAYREEIKDRKRWIKVAKDRIKGYQRELKNDKKTNQIFKGVR
jgi:hypothetical protein